jgi:hypothetical protein
VSPFDKNADLLKAYQAKYPGDPTLGVVFGTAAATVMNKILDKACKDGDLTPEGVTKAKETIGSVDTGGLAVPLDFQTGKSPSLKSYIFQAAKVPGGAKSVSDLYEGKDAAGFTPGG